MITQTLPIMCSQPATTGKCKRLFNPCYYLTSLQQSFLWLRHVIISATGTVYTCSSQVCQLYSYVFVLKVRLTSWRASWHPGKKVVFVEMELSWNLLSQPAPSSPQKKEGSASRFCKFDRMLFPDQNSESYLVKNVQTLQQFFGGWVGCSNGEAT